MNSYLFFPLALPIFKVFISAYFPNKDVGYMLSYNYNVQKNVSISSFSNTKSQFSLIKAICFSST
jgi:hypothetical protein